MDVTDEWDVIRDVTAGHARMGCDERHVTMERDHGT